MIVSELAGGLGDQLFQYAAGRAVADRLGAEFGLDLRPLHGQGGRVYGLDAFAVRARIIPDGDLAGVHPPRSWRSWVRRGWWEALQRVIHPPAFGSLRPVVYRGAGFVDLLTHVADGAWLGGWWQSEKYFADIADRLRADLAFKSGRDATAHALRRLRQADWPVAIHVRRGDYAAVASTRAYHGLCSIQYYEAAVRLVLARHPSASFFLFSDEPAWVAAHLHVPDSTLMTGNDAYPQDDLQLMASCRAHIVANSSFSWWGAWLANSDLVIAPERWFQAPDVSDADIVPERWLRL